MKFLSALLASLAAKFLTAEIAGWWQDLERWIVRAAARRAPAKYRKLVRVEWRRVLERLEGRPVSRMIAAVDLLRGAGKLRREHVKRQVRLPSAVASRGIDITVGVSNADGQSWTWSGPHASLVQEAYEWVVLLEGVGLGERDEEYAAWVRQSPAHLSAVLDAVRAFSMLEEERARNPKAFSSKTAVPRIAGLSIMTPDMHAFQNRRAALVSTNTRLVEQWRSESIPDARYSLAMASTATAQAAIDAILTEWMRSTPARWYEEGKRLPFAGFVNAFFKDPVTAMKLLTDEAGAVERAKSDDAARSDNERWYKGDGPLRALEAVRICDQTFFPKGRARGLWSLRLWCWRAPYRRKKAR